MNVIATNKLERDRQISLRNLRELDCAGKPAQRSTFSHPAPDLQSAAPAALQSGRGAGHKPESWPDIALYQQVRSQCIGKIRR